MSKKSLLAATAVLALAMGAAFAQNPPAAVEPNPLNPFTPESVTPESPFGVIDVTAAGDAPQSVRTYLEGLGGAELIELIQRCLVIDPIDQWGVTVAGGDDAMAPAATAAAAYGAETTRFCLNLRAVVFGDASAIEALEAAAEPIPAEVAMTTVTYTGTQADRGEDAYQDECALCHGERLSGGAESPALVGSGFRSAWFTGQTALPFYTFISVSMPATAPGSLSPETYADIMAYIVERNGYAAGDAELPADPDALDHMIFPDR